MLRKEYPPILSGKPEEQAAQLRAYLVRLIGYIDEAFNGISAGGASADQQAALTEWQMSVSTAIGSLRTAAKYVKLIQNGTVNTTTNVEFGRIYASKPAVFATAGTISNVSVSGFTLTTSGEAQWIAVGDEGR